MTEEEQELRDAVVRLEHGPDAPAETILFRALTEARPETRRLASEAMGRLAHFFGRDFSKATRSTLYGHRNDPEPVVRAELCLTLGLLDRPADEAKERTRIAIELLEDEDPRVRREAAAALGDISPELARDALLRHVDDEDEEVRFEAAFALSPLAIPECLPLFLAALDRPARRLDALEGLGRLQNREAIEPLEVFARRFLISWADRLTAWSTLVRLGAPYADQIIEKTAARRREERTYAIALVGQRGLEAGRATLEAIAGRAGDPLRDVAIRALVELGPEPSRETLGSIARDESAPAAVRAEAQEALDSLASPP